jgi:diadenosine tetraphosphate (Ap4A) HIT family hydrolase
MADFRLADQLAADTYPVGRLALSRVLLMNDARFPWLILVPEHPGIEEIAQLPPAERHLLVDEIAGASAALGALLAPDKINVGALGNRVRQLHVHVLARFVSDAAWPGPVWGAGEAVPYPPHAAGVMIDRVAGALARSGLQEIDP